GRRIDQGKPFRVASGGRARQFGGVRHGSPSRSELGTVACHLGRAGHRKPVGTEPLPRRDVIRHSDDRRRFSRREHYRTTVSTTYAAHARGDSSPRVTRSHRSTHSSEEAMCPTPWLVFGRCPRPAPERPTP